MRTLALASALAATALLSPSVVSAHRGTRRSLSFRPPLKVDFSTSPLQLPNLSSRDPYEVAHDFLTSLAFPSGSHFIRKDSYTDKATGISHIYVRQVVNGLEVADGNINLNIRNGQVLSYGNSFFNGSVNLLPLLFPNWHQAIYCNGLSTGQNDPACGSTLDRIQSVALLYELDLVTQYHDPRAAAFFFMQAAHPDLASLAFTFTSLKVERYECIDQLEEEISSSGWLISGFSEKLKPIRARQVYVQTPGAGDSTYLNLAWRLEVPLLPNDHYEAYVSVNNPTQIISVSSRVVSAPAPDNDGWLSTLEREVLGRLQAPTSTDQVIFDPVGGVASGTSSTMPMTGTYRVWKWGINDPESGKRTLEGAPVDRRGSPLGWHSLPAGKDPLNTHPDLEKNAVVNYTTTVGNNVFVQENWAGDEEWKAKRRADGGPDLVFDFPYGADPSEPDWEKVEPRQYANLSITQIFYTANMYHDLLYHYGFDEVSGNFQQHNFGKGGAEGDAVIIHVQHGGTVNDAVFSLTPDGEPGECHMFLWDASKPMRDSALDAGIVTHELSHGLSSRLTGGPRDPNCLRDQEAAAMGEGWSDFIATTVRSTRTYKDYPVGAWAGNVTGGFRDFPYSTNITINPLSYDRLQGPDNYDEHAMGTVWAQILWVVSNKLIDKHGFADSLFPLSQSDFYRYMTHEDGHLSKFPRHGNTLMLQLIINGMKSQPCNPTFRQARDAIIAADEALTGGENKCTLWRAFASRGLGTDARQVPCERRSSIDGFEVPPECE